MPLNNQWKLPKPERKYGCDWQPVVRLGSVVPFGYKQDPDDKDVLLPIEDELDALEVAKDLLKEYSAREVSAWLSETTGRYISYPGLLKRVKIEQETRQTASIYKHYQRRAEEAAAKALRYESRIGGRIARGEGPGDGSGQSKSSED